MGRERWHYIHERLFTVSVKSKKQRSNCKLEIKRDGMSKQNKKIKKTTTNHMQRCARLGNYGVHEMGSGYWTDTSLYLQSQMTKARPHNQEWEAPIIIAVWHRRSGHHSCKIAAAKMKILCFITWRKKTLQKSILVGTEIHHSKWIKPLAHVCGRMPRENSHILFPVSLAGLCRNRYAVIVLHFSTLAIKLCPHSS